MLADIQEQTFDLDHFDPALVDYEAINELATEGTLPNVHLDILGIGVEKQGALQGFNNFRNQLHESSGTAFMYQDEVDPDNGCPAIQYDVFNTRFPANGALYQSPISHGTHFDFLDIFNEDLGVGSQPFVPPELNMWNDIEVEHKVELMQSALPSTIHTLQGVWFEEPSDMSVLQHGLPYEPNILAKDEASPLRDQGQVIQDCNSNSPNLFHTTIAKKRNERPIDTIEDGLTTPVTKRCKSAHVSQGPETLSVMEHVLPQKSRKSNVSQETALPTSSLDHYDLVPVSMPQMDSQPLSVPRTQHYGSTTPISPATAGRLRFASYTQAQHAAASRTNPHDWTPLEDDATLPLDDEHRSLYVKMLTRAFKDTSKCIDSEDMETFRHRWASIAAGNSAHVDEQMEAACWNIVRIAEDLHTKGPISLGVFDKSKLKDIQKSGALTFLERLTKVCELMCLSKSRCGKLLKFEGLHMVVATPAQLITYTGWNKRQNTMRQENLVAGRKVRMAKMDAELGSDDEYIDNEGTSNLLAAQAQHTIQPDVDFEHPSQIFQLRGFSNETGSITFPLGYDYTPTQTHSNALPSQQTSGPQAYSPLRATLDPHPQPRATTTGATNEALCPGSPELMLRRKRARSDLDDVSVSSMPPVKRRGKNKLVTGK